MHIDETHVPSNHIDCYKNEGGSIYCAVTEIANSISHTANRYPLPYYICIFEEQKGIFL